MKDQALLDIVERAIGGDETAFLELCMKKGRDILYISIRLLNDRQKAEDAAQEIFLYMKDHIGELRNSKAFYIWLYRIINGTCWKMREKEKYRVEEIDQKQDMSLEDRKEFLPQEFLEDGVKKRLLLDILQDLPYKYRACVLLFYYENLSYKEIAQSLHLNQKEVSNALFRSKQSITGELERMPHTRRYMQKLPAVAEVPVMSQILQSNMDAEVSGDTIVELMSKSVGIPPGYMGVHAVTESIHKGTAAGSTTAKLTVGLVVGISLAAYGIVSFHNTDQEEVLYDTGYVTGGYEEQQMTLIPEQEEEEVIRTLEDMIGEEDAAYLRLLSQADAPDRVEAERFLNDIGLRSGEAIWRAGEAAEHTFYSMTKQNKKLMVVSQYKVEVDGYGLVYRFTDDEEPVPENYEITLVYEEWKE